MQKVISLVPLIFSSYALANPASEQTLSFHFNKIASNYSNIDFNNQITEDLGSLFFDFDNDGDLDLYVSSGG